MIQGKQSYMYESKLKAIQLINDQCQCLFRLAQNALTKGVIIRNRSVIKLSALHEADRVLCGLKHDISIPDCRSSEIKLLLIPNCRVFES